MSYNNIRQTTGHRHEILLQTGDGRPISQFPQNTNNQYNTYQKLAQQAAQCALKYQHSWQHLIWVRYKRVELLKRIIEIRSGPNDKQKRARLITLCVTRFTERHFSVKVLRELLPFVVLAVEQLMTWQSLETKKEALNIACLIKNVRFIVGLLMLESITAVLKPATESLQGKQVDLGSCMTTITLMKQQLQEMNGDYWHNFLLPKIMKLGEELNVDIAKPRQAGGGNQSESVSEYYGKVWRSALQNVIDDLNLKFGPNQQHVISLQHLIPGFVPAAPVTDE